MGGGNNPEVKNQAQENLDVNQSKEVKDLNKVDSKVFADEVKNTVTKKIETKKNNETYDENNFDKDLKNLTDFINKQGKNTGVNIENQRNTNNIYNISRNGDKVENNTENGITTFTSTEAGKYGIEFIINQYNATNENKINITDFKDKFEPKQKEKIVKKTTVPDAEEKKEDTIETQIIGKIKLSEEQKNKISNTLDQVTKDGKDVTKVELIGEADGTQVTEKGEKIIKDYLDNQLQTLKNKGFDVSKLPTNYDTFQNSPIYNEIPGGEKANKAFALSRALTQISFLDPSQIKNLNNIQRKVKTNPEKGDQFTKGGINIFTKGSKEKTKEKLDNFPTNTSFEFGVRKPDGSIGIFTFTGQSNQDKVKLGFYPSIGSTGESGNLRSLLSNNAVTSKKGSYQKEGYNNTAIMKLEQNNDFINKVRDSKSTEISFDKKDGKMNETNANSTEEIINTLDSFVKLYESNATDKINTNVTNTLKEYKQKIEEIKQLTKTEEISLG